MRKLRFAEHEFYHIYNRGVDKRTIFYDKEDHDRFRAYLYVLNDVENLRVSNFLNRNKIQTVFEQARGEPLVAIGAYCLMPNHFHVLLSPLAEDGVSKFMQRLQTGYAMFFNEKRKRSGSLFEGPFKAKHVNTDEYLKYMFAYIHLNPAALFNVHWNDETKEGIANYFSKVEQYEYSSIQEYLSKKTIITDPKPFPRYFNTAKDIRSHLEFWHRYKNNYAENPDA